MGKTQRALGWMGMGLSGLSALTVASLITGQARAAAVSSPVPVIAPGGHARFTVYAAELIRLEYSPHGHFVDLPSFFAVERSPGFSDFQISYPSSSGGAPTLQIHTAKIDLTYRDDGKPFGPQNLQATIQDPDGKTYVWHAGDANVANLGGTRKNLDSVDKPLALEEGLISRDGWHVIDDTQSPLFTPDWVRWRTADESAPGTQDWYFFGYGSDYKGALRALTTAGGAVPLPRKYVFGSWYSRWWKYTSDDYRQVVRQYHEHGFPLDVLVMDMEWHKEGWTGWSYNRELLPDAENLMAWLHRQNLRVTLNDHPRQGVQRQEDFYADFMRAMDANPAGGPLGYDPGNRRYLDTLFKYAYEPHEKEGVDFWWLDWQEGAEFAPPSFTTLRWLNNYYYRHSEQNGQRGQSFARWTGWGDHRHPIHFSGDVHSDWPMLEFEVPYTSTAANAGAFYWSHDIGGFEGEKNEESFARWVQFGSVAPIMRLHSINYPKLDRRPWLYGKDVEASAHASFDFRAEIFPYLYSTAWQAYHDTLPLVRPMYLEYPGEPEAYRQPQQYFFGDAFLAAPIVSPGVGPGKLASQVVWIPEGDWYHVFTGEHFTAGKRVIGGALGEFPLLARGGYPIAMQEFTERPGSAPLAKLRVRAYPGPEGKVQHATLYEDDGLSQKYQSGEHALTDLSYERQGDRVRIEISPVQGHFEGQLAARAYRIELADTAAPGSPGDGAHASWAKVDGALAEVHYDAATWTTYVDVPSRSIGQAVTVEVGARAIADELPRQVALRARIEAVLGKSAALGPSAPAPSLAELIARYAHPHDAAESEKLVGLLELAGISIPTRYAHPYIYPADDKLAEVYIGSENLLARDAQVTVVDHFGADSRVLLRSECRPSAGYSCSYPIDQKADRARYPLGIRGVRSVELSFQVAASSGRLSEVLHIRKDLQAVESYLHHWSTVGPFAYDFDRPISKQVYPPEKGEPDLSAHYVSSEGRSVTWQKATANDEGAVDLRHLYDFDHRLSYAVTRFHSDRAQKMNLRVNTDDSGEIFLDGKRIYQFDGFRSLTFTPDLVHAKLGAGDHTLLVKVGNAEGGFGLRVSIEAPYPLSER